MIARLALHPSPRMARVWSRCGWVLLLLALPGFAFAAQTKAPAKAKTAMPTQAAALLQLAAQRNGLNAPGLDPWHIAVSYRTYKQNGHVKDAGRFEEWWAAPDEYHITFDRKGYHLQSWVTPKGSFAIGNPDLPMTERLVYHWMVAPIPQHPDLRGARLRYRVRLIGPDQFPCVQMDSRLAKLGDIPPQYPTYCFEAGQPLLRIVDTHVAEVVTMTAAGTLRGQYLPEHWIATLAARPIVSATLEVGQSYSRMDPSFFIPATDARPAPAPSTGLLYLTADEAALHLIPFSTMRGNAARALRESQVYTLLAVTIGANGHVKEIRIVGPVDPELIPDIYNAVLRWRYRPFLLHGVAVPVRTQIILDYRVPLPR
ncbi:MAG: energy transducer TonB [Acidobacteriaceae bacterium]